jgi:hypothetical protein
MVHRFLAGIPGGQRPGAHRGRVVETSPGFHHRHNVVDRLTVPLPAWIAAGSDALFDVFESIKEPIAKTLLECFLDMGKERGEAEIGGERAENVPGITGFAFELALEDTGDEVTDDAQDGNPALLPLVTVSR